MKRHNIAPRVNWQSRVEAQGLSFHSIDDEPYWCESACYSFTSEEIDRIEKATYALDDMCLKAVAHVLENDLLDALQISPRFHEWIYESWENEEISIYGRFDLALPADGIPRLLEYNADTPTALLEAAVIQWTWLKETAIGNDQFNSIHEKLIEVWSKAKSEISGTVYFSAAQDSLEDYVTANYLRDTAIQAGLKTEFLAMERIAWNEQRKQFVDAREMPLETCFKLYPWEWMLAEEFGPHLLLSETRWLEAPWKMVLSNKAILPILWQLFPKSPYLLRTELEPWGGSYVRKPMRGREGANVAVFENGNLILETEGPYTGPCVFQQKCEIPKFAGNYAVIGSWLVNGYACGIGIREDDQMVTTNASRFVPHYFS